MNFTSEGRSVKICPRWEGGNNHLEQDCKGAELSRKESQNKGKKAASGEVLREGRVCVPATHTGFEGVSLFSNVLGNWDK